ncbi:MAG: prepilin-type N-terminal cleavage/methylation domain-containing protein, partial [Phycisphaeraceae bacterium]
MMRQPNSIRRRALGFSLTELLVSISIIGLLVGLTFPVLRVLTGSSRVEAGLNVAGMSVAQIRRRLTRLLADGYPRDPEVTVQVEQYTSQPVQVLGA